MLLFFERRPLAFKFTALPSLEKQGETFVHPVVASLWDVPSDAKADPTTLNPPVTGVTCDISLITPNAVLTGTTTVNMDSSGDCSFSDLKITNDEEILLEHKLLLTPSFSTMMLRSGQDFQPVESNNVVVEARIHARKASMAMDYSGAWKNIQPVVDGFNKIMTQGSDEIIITPHNNNEPVDYTFTVSVLNKLKANCKKYPSWFSKYW